MAEHQEQGAQLSARRQELLRDLRSWATLQNIITTLSEEEAYWLMAMERASSNRIRVIMRLYSRFSLKRKERELQQLGGEECLL